MILKLEVKDREVKISQDHNLFTDGKYVDRLQVRFDDEWEEFTKVATFYVDENKPVSVPCLDGYPFRIPNSMLEERGIIHVGFIGVVPKEIGAELNFDEPNYIQRMSSSILTLKVKAGIASFENYITPEDTLWEEYVANMGWFLEETRRLHEEVNAQHREIEEVHHTDIKARHADVKAAQAEIREKHKDINEWHSDVDTKHADVAEKYPEIVADHEEVVEKHADVVRKHEEVTLLAQKTQDNTELAQQLTNQAIASEHHVSEMEQDVEARHNSITQTSKDIESRYHNALKVHEDITRQHDQITRHHDSIHKEVDKFEDIQYHAYDALDGMRKEVWTMDKLVHEGRHSARQAWDSELQARQSEINALDYELSARESEHKSHENAHKSKYYSHEAEHQARMAALYTDMSMPEFYLDPETMTLAIKEPENHYQLQFKAEANVLYWNFLGYVRSTADGDHYHGDLDTEGEVVG